MAASLDLSNLKESISEQKVKLHYMPCIIEKSGEAKVSTYFEPLIRKRNDNGNVLIASFRGYPLLGKEVIIPDNYCGIILKEPEIRSIKGQVLYGTHIFDNFTHWNWDSEPSDDDKIISAMEWLDVAQVLHSPVDS